MPFVKAALAKPAPTQIFVNQRNRSGPLASQWTRELKADAELKAQYEAQKTTRDKAQFRTRWAQLKLQAANQKLELIKSEVHTLDESMTGTYLPFRRLWEREGMDKSGFEAPLGIRTYPNPMRGKT